MSKKNICWDNFFSFFGRFWLQKRCQNRQLSITFSKTSIYENRWFSFGKSIIFRVSSLQNPPKIDVKSHSKKASPKITENSILASIFAFQNLPKSLQNHQNLLRKAMQNEKGKVGKKRSSSRVTNVTKRHTEKRRVEKRKGEVISISISSTGMIFFQLGKMEKASRMLWKILHPTGRLRSETQPGLSKPRKPWHIYRTANTLKRQWAWNNSSCEIRLKRY